MRCEELRYQEAVCFWLVIALEALVHNPSRQCRVKNDVEREHKTVIVDAPSFCHVSDVDGPNPVLNLTDQTELLRLYQTGVV